MLNLALFSGNKVVEPENVEELDGSERYSIPSASGKREHSIKKDRDILRKVTIDNDNFCTRLIAGVEQQSDVHYAMPVRDMLYDSLKYTQQLDFGELSDEVTELILDYKMVLLQP